MRESDETKIAGSKTCGDWREFRDKQQEAARLLDTLASGASSEPNGTGVDRRPIWEIVEEVNAGLPADTWDSVPTDGSINLDHYLHGAPKQQP